MKLGAVLSMFEDYGSKRYEKMKEFGFEYVDFHVDDDICNMSEDDGVSMIMREKALAEESGIIFSQVHGPWIYPPHDETESRRAARAEVMKRSIRYTSLLGCDKWVIHPLMPFGALDDYDYDRFLDINYNFFKELLPTANECGVTICLENMPMKFMTISTPERTLELVRMIDDERFKFCLDTGHAAVMGVSPADAVHMAGRDLAALHIHDNDGEGDFHRVPLTGVVDWRAFTAALRDEGFDGVFSFECRLGEFIPHAALDTKIKAFTSIVDELIGY